MNWQSLERKVRKVATLKWDTKAIPLEVNGVRVDCVLKPKKDFWVLVEVSKQNTLDKLRTDLAKFATTRPYLFSQGIYAECYFICENCPPQSLRKTGEGSHVNVYGSGEFESLFFDFKSYAFTRKEKKFGSAVDIKSGEKDTRKYIPVKYENLSNSQELSIQDIAGLLRNGKRVVLLGDYGTGKSRCVQELFTLFAEEKSQELFYPIAIDLRENWGLKRAHEIIKRHFDELAHPDLANGIIKVLDNSAACFLLDGFDEIGSQVWSDDPGRLTEIRKESLAGVKDMVERSKGGLLITGRKHYFNSSEEMYNCLGLDPSQTIGIQCRNQFTTEEMQAYLHEINAQFTLPDYLPRRPLICQVIAEMDEDTIAALSKNESGETSFWSAFILALCEREARIKTTLDAFVIRGVLKRLARITRTKGADVGPISIAEINQAFEDVTGNPPAEDSSAMLQRLPGLGRFTSETSDRQFVDHYILDGLRAEDLIDQTNLIDYQGVIDELWQNPLRRFGLALVAQEYHATSNTSGYLSLMQRSASRFNKILSGDILSALLMAENRVTDFNKLTLSDAHFHHLDFAKAKVKNLTIKDSIIEFFDITDCQTDNVSIENCIIQQLYGISSEEGLPDWFHENDIQNYEAINTVTRIKHAGLQKNQQIFLTIVKKLFFQAGGGRRETTLSNQLGTPEDIKITKRILNLLLAENIVTRNKGVDGYVYHPQRKHTKRISSIFTKLTTSDDPLWKAISKL